MFKQPYKYWSREQLYRHLKRQAIEYNIDTNIVFEACFSLEWDPIKQFNGCNFVEDSFHPFAPCFIHDYRWITKGGSNEIDKEFRNNLLKTGYSTFRATCFYLGVRIGWFFYYKWVK